MRVQAEAVAVELFKGSFRAEPGKRKLLETRKAIEDGWRSIARLLVKDGRRDLAVEAQRFLEQMSPAKTVREQIAAQTVERVHLLRDRNQSITR